MDPLSHAFAACRASLDAYIEAPGESARWVDLRRQRIATAQLLAGRQRDRPEVAALQAALELRQRILCSGALDHAIDAADLAVADRLAKLGIPGLIAATLVTPAWQWPNWPAFACVPEALWPAHVAWLFHAPQGFREAGHAARYADHYLRCAEDLRRLASSRQASKSLQTALGVFASAGNAIPLYFTEGSLLRHMIVRGELLRLWAGCIEEEVKPRPREGRRLRVGFINRHFGAQTETYTTLPSFEHLDPEKFEVCLFAHHCRDSALEKYVRGRAVRFEVLPAGLPDQLKTLREARLDVAVFGTNVTAVVHEVTRLALHRVAPLQVVNNSSCVTSGLPTIDVYVSGTMTEMDSASGHFSERLALLRGPAHAFNYEVDRQEPVKQWRRDELGVPEPATVFVSAANYFKITPEMRDVWARLLARVPCSRLVLHPFNPNWSSQYPIKRFRAEMVAALRAHGVDASRLVISTQRFPSRADVKALLAVGDVYLDTFPFGGVNSLVDPLELGMPVVAWEGATMRSRMGAALLRQLNLDEWVARTEEEYVERAVSLANDGPRRIEIGTRIRKGMENVLFLDSLAASDQFGSVLETAFDELCAIGLQQFRAGKTPLLCADSVPLDGRTRLDRACALLRGNRVARAVEYLLAAVGQRPDDAECWFVLAEALMRDRKKPQAVQALEVVVRIDPDNGPAWTRLAALAEELGMRGRALEAGGHAARLSPSEFHPSSPRSGPLPVDFASTSQT